MNVYERIGWRLRSIPLGYIETQELSRFLDKVGSDPYLISIARYAVYKGLQEERKVLEKMDGSETSRRIKEKQLSIIKSAIKAYESGREMFVSGITIPPSDQEIRERDKNLIEKFANYDY